MWIRFFMFDHHGAKLDEVYGKNNGIYIPTV